MLAKSKLNSIETLVSKAQIDMETSQKDFITILKKKDKYEKMKENVRNVSKKLEKNKKIWEWIVWIQEGYHNFRPQEVKNDE